MVWRAMVGWCPKDANIFLGVIPSSLFRFFKFVQIYIYIIYKYIYILYIYYIYIIYICIYIYLVWYIYIIIWIRGCCSEICFFVSSVPKVPLFWAWHQSIETLTKYRGFRELSWSYPKSSKIIQVLRPWLSIETNYHLVMTNSLPWFFRWPIEIDGLPIKNGGSFHGKLLVITRW